MRPTLTLEYQSGSKKGDDLLYISRLVLKCAYEDRGIAKRASFGAARWQKTRKCWTLPVEPTIIKSLMDTFTDLHIAEDVWDYLEQMRSHQEDVILSTQDEEPLSPQDKLWPFQRASVRFLDSVGKGILAHEMGLGKTPISCAGIDYLGLARVVIVCPNSVKWSWVDHLVDWAKRDDIYVMESSSVAALGNAAVLTGSSQHRDDSLSEILSCQEEFILILNYDQARIHQKTLRYFDYDLVIADEAHRLKNRKAQRTEAFKRIASKTVRLWLLTGTPIRNNYMDIWTLLNLCDPIRFSSYWHFMGIFMETTRDYWSGAPTPVGLRDKQGFNSMLSCYTYRKTKQEVLPDLPNKIYQDYKLPLNPQQEKVYKTMEKEFLAVVNQAVIDGKDFTEILYAPTTISQIIRLRQICLTPELIGGVADSAKIDALLDILSDVLHSRGNAIVFSFFKGFLPYVAKILINYKVPFGYITGDQSSSQRALAQKQLESGEIKVILGTGQAMGEGMNLQAATTAIFCDVDWVPAVNEQAEDRIHRGDIHQSPLIIRLYHPNTIEADIAAACRIKKNIIDSTTGAVESIRQMLLRREVMR